MAWKGFWDAYNNVPYLHDGIGAIGDEYGVSTAGSQNLGSGSITFDFGCIVTMGGDLTWDKVSCPGSGSGGGAVTSVSNGDGTINVSPNVGAVVISAGATVVLTTGSYADPSWITSLAWSKIASAPSFITLTALSATSPVAYNNSTGVISIANAAADGSTKGAAAFATADFNSSSGVISIDYANGQAASGAVKGFLTSADWTTFNSKQSALSGSGIVFDTAGTISYITGSSAQFVKADGSLDSSTYITSAVTSVSGTTNRITSTGGATPAIDISSTFEALLGKVASPLSQFAATTSAQLAGIISDETGSGALVFATSPTLVTPALGTPSSGVLTNCTSLPLTAGVTGVLPVANGGTNASSASITAFNNITGYTAAGATGTTSTNLVFSTSPTLVTPILGTPTSGTLTNCTSLPISTGVSGLGSNVAAMLATFSSVNIASACTDETGSGALVFATSPTLVTPLLGTPTSGTLTNCTSLPVSTGISGLGTGVATFLATPSSANLASAITDETGSGALVFAVSPALTGSPTVPTQTAADNSTKAASTAYVDRAMPLVVSTTSTATLTINADVTDIAILTAQAAALTIASPTGTPVQGQQIMIRIKDNATARALTWNSIFRASSDLALPTTTIISKTMYVYFIYNSTDTKWDMISYLNNF